MSLTKRLLDEMPTFEEKILAEIEEVKEAIAVQAELFESVRKMIEKAIKKYEQE